MSNIDLSKAIPADTIRSAGHNALSAQLAELRLGLESDAVELPDGMAIQASRAARAELATQHFLRQTGVAEGPLNWKGPQGWISLSPDMLGLVLWKISTRVQALFRAEQQVQAQITSDELTTFAEVEQAFLEALDQSTR
ncbi:MAG: hypothetical protein QGI08_10645 [Paracoccaceae bacterium]|jgi:hypothetical protein|nr:hypothetical protein [Paracoccaceae bacterium]MDP7186169.1 hypothetical protein [Paracoccaceae bacterium]